MLKILVSIDGSASAMNALRHVIALRDNGLAVETHLINVQLPLASGHAKMFISSDDYNRYCQHEAQKLLAGARALLDDGQVPYRHHIIVGHIGESIVRFAKEQGMDAICMGAQGVAGIAERLMGSVASTVLDLAPMPVTLVK